MNHDLTISQSILIDAAPAKVWEGLTNPAIIKEYLYGTEAVTDWKVGSEMIFQGEYEGHKYRDKGKVLENIPLKRLSYSYWSGFSGLEDKPGNYSSVSYDLKSDDGKKTLFTWTQKGFSNEKGYEHTKNSMPGFLKKIKEVIERP